MRATTIPPALRPVWHARERCLSGCCDRVCAHARAGVNANRNDVTCYRRLSSSTTKRLWRRCRSGVHSRNSMRLSRAGLTHRQSFILSAVSPSPHLPGLDSGRLTNGHSEISNGVIFHNSAVRDEGVNPLRVRATYTSLPSTTRGSKRRKHFRQRNSHRSRTPLLGLRASSSRHPTAVLVDTCCWRA